MFLVTISHHFCAMEVEKNIAFVILSVCYFIFGIPLNLTIVFLYPFQGKTSTLSNYFIKFLAKLDVFTCLIIVPCIATMELASINNVIFCKITIALSFLTMTYSFLTSMSIAVERWFAIHKPHILKKKHVIILNFVNIVTAGFSGGFSAVDYKIFKKISDDNIIHLCRAEENKVRKSVSYFLTSGFSFIMTIVIILYISVFRVVVKRMKVSAVTNAHELKKISDAKVQFKSAAMLFGVTLIFLLCWIPIFLSFYGIEFPLSIKYMTFINNSTNCLIYMIFQEKFRKRVINRLLNFLHLKRCNGIDVFEKNKENSLPTVSLNM